MRGRSRLAARARLTLGWWGSARAGAETPFWSDSNVNRRAPECVCSGLGRWLLPGPWLCGCVCAAEEHDRSEPVSAGWGSVQAVPYMLYTLGIAQHSEIADGDGVTGKSVTGVVRRPPGGESNKGGLPRDDDENAGRRSRKQKKHTTKDIRASLRRRRGAIPGATQGCFNISSTPARRPGCAVSMRDSRSAHSGDTCSRDDVAACQNLCLDLGQTPVKRGVQAPFARRTGGARQ